MPSPTLAETNESTNARATTKSSSSQSQKSRSRDRKTGSSARDLLCANSKLASDSQLCAEWKSADAAQLSAKYSREQTRIAWLSFALSIATTVAAVFAAIFTGISVRVIRKQAQDGEKALEFSRKSAEISSRHAEQSLRATVSQLRPWVEVEIYENSIKAAHDKSRAVTLHLRIKNHGATPAFNLKCRMFFGLICSGTDVDLTSNIYQDIGMNLYSGEARETSFGRSFSLQEVECITNTAQLNSEMPLVVCNLQLNYSTSLTDDERFVKLRYVIAGNHGDIEWLRREPVTGIGITRRSWRDPRFDEVT